MLKYLVATTWGLTTGLLILSAVRLNIHWIIGLLITVPSFIESVFKLIRGK